MYISTPMKGKYEIWDFKNEETVSSSSNTLLTWEVIKIKNWNNN